jgi:lipopolysaccharide transport system ATP-binding protein
MHPIIEVKNICKRYRLGQFTVRTLREEVERLLRRSKSSGAILPTLPLKTEFWALRDISFSVERGEVLGIIGRNGSGKSTLLKILSRVTEPTKGEIRLRGRTTSLLEVGTGFHPDLTGRENIFLNGAILGMSRAEVRSKFEEIVEFAEIDKFLDTPVKRYSSGMYVRLAFAVAAHLESEILVVDEVLAVGDVAFQRKCLEKLNSVAKDGRTILFVTHNLDVLRSFCKRVLLLKEGQLVEDGSLMGGLKKYLADIQSGIAYLQDWADRITTNDVRIRALEVFDSSGAHSGAISLGESVRFRMTVAFKEPISRPIFGILICSANGEPLVDINSAQDKLHIDIAKGVVTVESELKSFSLYPGEYTLSPWVQDVSGTTLDFARYCCGLQVAYSPSAFGKLYQEWGKYFIESFWSIETSATEVIEIDARQPLSSLVSQLERE